MQLKYRGIAYEVRESVRQPEIADRSLRYRGVAYQPQAITEFSDRPRAILAYRGIYYATGLKTEAPTLYYPSQPISVVN
ncbi:DUF4278 domain-containing protein [Baaleninema simplex]|uniref:DUF4278 domain-containing protein n=1 Tax=Baaleninema simplex TaxID=2862350 RepID=UPI00034CD03E|nr:DUF4278 domain-containing protein [Baaleninema simplex]